MKQYKFRDIKPKVGQSLSVFGVCMNTTCIWDRDEEQYTLELGMTRDITFDDLEGLSKLFGTKAINFSPSKNEYYGDITHSSLHITISADQLNQWFLTAEETAIFREKEAKKQKDRELYALKQQAKSLGYKVSKE